MFEPGTDTSVYLLAYSILIFKFKTFYYLLVLLNWAIIQYIGKLLT